MKKLIYLLPLICAILVVGPIEAKKKKYPNGDVYNGKWKKGNPHGEGEMKYANGDIYYGNWDYGIKSGTGIMNYKNGDYFEGNWNNNMPEKGTMKFANGDIYIGEFANGFINGTGKMIFQSGDTYSGQWRNGKQDGFGKTEYKVGDNFEGYWKNGMKHGKGKIIHTNGDIYLGTWNKNEQLTYGELITYRNNQRISYKGEWKNNALYDGEIRTITSLGECIIECIEGVESTKGTIKNSKWEYEGDIVDYIPFGYGIITLKNKKKINVIIDKNKIEATIVFSNNAKEIERLINKDSLTCNWVKNSDINTWIDSIQENIIKREKNISYFASMREYEIRAEQRERTKRSRERIATENKISKIKKNFPNQIWYPSEIYNIYRNNPAQLSFFKSGYTILHATIQDIERYTETDYNEFVQDFITTTMYRFYLQGGLILRVHEPSAIKLSKGQKVYLLTQYTDNVIDGRPLFRLNHILGNTQDAALNYILKLTENGNLELHLRSKAQ